MHYGIQVQGKVALVTGGARGIGAEIVRAFLQNGAFVAAADVQFPESYEGLEGDEQPRLLTLETDVTDEDSVRHAFSVVKERFGTIHILVNNAGIMYKDPIDTIDLEHWNRAVAVNLTGPVICSREAFPFMKSQKWGRIVNISSMMAVLGAETYSAYCATKAGLHQLSKVWAAEGAPYGITANSICPGWVYTPMVELFIDRVASVHKIDRETALSKIFSIIPQRRFIDPEEIAFAALFLCSELARGVNGAAVNLDTGLSAVMPLGLHVNLPEEYGKNEMAKVLNPAGF